MPADTLLRCAYGINVAILLPVVVSLARSDSPAAVFGPGVPDSRGLRLLVPSLWTGILVSSALGLLIPLPFAGILVLQIVYKAVWLWSYVRPQSQQGRPVPWAPAGVFASVVILWPMVIIVAGP